MILVDYSQVCISSIMAQTGGAPAKLNEELVRHMIVNTLRSFIGPNKRQFGETVICCDSRHFWRRDVFPYYKAHRKKDRDADALDWGEVFTILDKIKGELKEFFPYKVLEVHGAEADDVIAVLAKKYAPHEKVLIISSDKDFLQLQSHPNITQFSNIQKKFITTDNAGLYLAEHIIRGDRGDGVPNFQSPDDTFVKPGGRQKPLNKTKVESWVSQKPEDFCKTEDLRGYKRNQLLIDLDQVPQNIKEAIIQEYDDCKPGSKNKMLNYFIAKKLTNLMESLTDF